MKRRSAQRACTLRFGALALLLAGGGAFAQPIDPPVRYTVRPGDTLLTLARLYMIRTADYLTVQQLNKVRDPRSLPVGSTLLVPDALLRTEPVIAEISAFKGAATLDGQPVALGMKVRQGMKVATGANAFVTVKMPDGSMISLPSQSRITVSRLRRILLTGGVDRNFLLEAGRSRSTVTPIRDPGSSFRVTTPLSVSAVRGTDFRVALDPAAGAAMTEVVGGTVGVAPGAEKPETAVPKAFGIIGTAAGLGEAVALLPAPRLLKVDRTGDTTIAISVGPVEGAKSYRVQLASDVGFADIFDEAVSDTPTATFTLSASVTFFIRLTAIATSGLEGLPGTFALGGPTG